ncbi:MAG: peptidoglycan DD-metalloendopeptidase family protein [Deltaproteobacteria bacterium]|nr:peptidoglycan DD-metalloendopeptidase family protein [Deltaproteobacteria bacterium]
MSYQYPIDVGELVSLAKKRGDAFVKAAGLEDGLRDDEKLNAILWNATLGWFPVTQEGKWHGALDIGVPDPAGDGGIFGKPVKAIADGQVVFVEDLLSSTEGFDFGRVIVRHQTPAGETFYAQYRHLDPVMVWPFQPVKAGDELGQVGWHGDFPHVELSVASLFPIGGAEDLVPEAERSALPQSSGVWNVARVRVEGLDFRDWPIPELGGEAGFLFNPVELIRHCRGEPYRHLIGPGTIHEVEPVPEGPQKPLAPGEDLTVEVGAVLRSAALASCEPLVKLAHDPAFTPLAKGHGDKPVVEAIQRALKACAYDMGRFGPDRDGVDGDYGATTERVVKEFQTGKLKEMMEAAGDAGILGKKKGDLKSDGKVDWLTLMGLDISAALHEPMPAQDPVPSADPPPERKPEPTKPPAPLSNTFDATKGTRGLCLHFGARMYLALLDWLWEGKWDKDKADKDAAYLGDPKGVGYSTCNHNHYGPAKTPEKKKETDPEAPSLENKMAALDTEFQNEWPDVALDACKAKVPTKDVQGKTYNVYKAFGLTCIGTDYTNCCMSQLAALACALKGGKLTVKGGSELLLPRSGETTYEIAKDSVKARIGVYEMQKKQVEVEVKGKKVKKTTKVPVYVEADRGVLLVFAQTFVTANGFYNKDKKPLSGKDPGLNADGEPEYEPYPPKTMEAGGMVYGVEALGIGERLFPFNPGGNEQADLKKLRLSDLATWEGHAWMVGDVRYGVWTEDGRKGQQPDYILDQSSFLGASGDAGVYVKRAAGVPMHEHDGRASQKASFAEKKDEHPTREEVEWLLDAANEQSFLDRVKRFLELEPDAAAGRAAGKVRIDGKERVILKIEALTWRVFSANGGFNTAHSVEMAGTGKGKKKGPFEPDRKAAGGDGSSSFERCGITRPWCSTSLKNLIAAARLYGPPSHTAGK